MIGELSSTEPVRELCQLLGVARSGYYHWLRGKESAGVLTNGLLLEQIRQLFKTYRGNYGSPRITRELRRRGQSCNRKRVERLMRKDGLKGRVGCARRVRTTHSDHDQPIAPNLLLGRAAPSKVDEVWVADITYVPTAEGWMFLAAVMDLYSRQIIGWSLWENLEAGGPLQALARALIKRGHPRNVIHHSDRGIQYASWKYRQQLEVSAAIGTQWFDRQYESQRQLLRQRGHGGLLEHAQKGSSGTKCALVQRSSATGDLRIHRSDLQPDEAPQLSGISITCGIRKPKQLEWIKTST